MTRTPLRTRLSLDHVLAYAEGDGFGSAELYLWTVFFKIDGDTVVLGDDAVPARHVRARGERRAATATSATRMWTRATTCSSRGRSASCWGRCDRSHSPTGSSTSCRQSPTRAGWVGVVFVLMEEDQVSDGGAEAGHARLNSLVEEAINGFILPVGVVEDPGRCDDEARGGEAGRHGGGHPGAQGPSTGRDPGGHRRRRKARGTTSGACWTATISSASPCSRTTTRTSSTTTGTSPSGSSTSPTRRADRSSTEDWPARPRRGAGRFGGLGPRTPTCVAPRSTGRRRSPRARARDDGAVPRRPEPRVPRHRRSPARAVVRRPRAVRHHRPDRQRHGAGRGREPLQLRRHERGDADGRVPRPSTRTSTACTGRPAAWATTTSAAPSTHRPRAATPSATSRRRTTSTTSSTAPGTATCTRCGGRRRRLPPTRTSPRWSRHLPGRLPRPPATRRPTWTRPAV